MNIITIFLTLAIIWICLLTVFVIWFYFRLKKLISSAKDGNFLKVLKKIETSQESILADIKDTQKDLNFFKETSKDDFQKLGISKFNPFNDTGGENSFSIALLNGYKSGVILTSLHSRDRTRFYLKEVSAGKSSVELSKDEYKALDKALKQ